MNTFQTFVNCVQQVYYPVNSRYRSNLTQAEYGYSLISMVAINIPFGHADLFGDYDKTSHPSGYAEFVGLTPVAHRVMRRAIEYGIAVESIKLEKGSRMTGTQDVVHCFAKGMVNAWADAPLVAAIVHEEMTLHVAATLSGPLPRLRQSFSLKWSDMVDAQFCKHLVATWAAGAGRAPWMDVTPPSKGVPDQRAGVRTFTYAVCA